jgi:transcription elongation factor Elf1
MHNDDDDEDRRAPLGQKFFEFDCPNCNAYNPWPDGFVARDEINCHYCGTSFEARVTDEGRLKLKEL